LILAGLFLSNCTLPCLAQNPEGDDVIRVRTDLVTVPTMVLDGHGRRIANLNGDDFIVRDEGKVVRLEHFSNGSDRVALIFLLDASGSSENYLNKQREAALSLFARFGPGSQIAVLRFREQASVAVPFTADVGSARSGFEFPAAAGHHTGIFDSVQTAIQLFQDRKHDATERRIIILTSDGLDSASTLKAKRVIENAQANNITLYVIHFPLFAPSGGHLAVRPPTKGFRELAEKTGGQYFLAGDVKTALDQNARFDLGAVFKAIEADLASQYLLGFYPNTDAATAGLHRIAVELKHNGRGYRIKTLRENYNLKH